MRYNSHIEQYCSDLLHKYGLMTAPVDLNRLIRCLGVTKHEGVLDADVWGMAITDGHQKIISINKQQSETRKRFTIAHEIAHIVLDSEVPVNVDKKIYYRDGTSDWRETRANFFASALLMPKELLLNHLRSISPDLKVSDEEIESLARRFKVSPQAMYIRLEKLQLT